MARRAITSAGWLALAVAAAFAIAAGGATLASADDRSHSRHQRDNWRPPHWRGHDIRRFHQRDYDHWRRGTWYRGRHDGRDAWWWTFGGLWYPYPAPVYPYPDPYQPPVVVAPPSPTTYYPSVYYYCPNPEGYYPYVAECPEGWQAVPAPAPH